MLRRLRWELAILRLLFSSTRFTSTTVTAARSSHRNEPKEFPPNCDSYGRLAQFWNQCGVVANRYSPFLQAAGRYHAVPIGSVLDLACGTGLLTRQIASWAGSVVGLDVSESMLEQARSQTGNANVRYVLGDFMTFALEQAFDVVTCCGDSINYLRTPADLATVLQRVREHLVPGGLFIFDTLDHRYFQAMAETKLVMTVGADQFEIFFFYDPIRRVSEARVVLGDVIEEHRRIPLGRKEVYGASRKSGLEIAGNYSFSRYLTPAVIGRRYYILRKCGT